MADEICGTEVTVDHIQAVLQNHFGTRSTIVRHEANEIRVKKGFVSKVFRVKLTWKQDESSLPTSLIVKIPRMVNFSKLFETLDKADQRKVMQRLAQLDSIKQVIYQLATSQR